MQYSKCFHNCLQYYKQTMPKNSVHRLQKLSDVFRTPNLLDLQIRYASSTGNAKSNGIVKIGDVSKPLKTPASLHYVPVSYLPKNTPQVLLKHLQWMMQKDNLGQDMFLIGPPGPLKRRLALMYAEMTQREVEYVALSRDTTETDLKQRREIRAGTAYHLDQCAVRAATQGRLLILEGIEKTERNVLPVLNNLLENREMQLEDGRFLTSAKRFDQLLKDHSEDELLQWKLVRVHEDFRVIALGLPVPRFQGNPLDPPLRSRFQARDIGSFQFEALMDTFGATKSSNLSSDVIAQLVSVGTTLKTSESASLGLPDFPTDNLPPLMMAMSHIRNLSKLKAIKLLYPYEIMLSDEGKEAIQNVFKSFDFIAKEKGTETDSFFINEIHQSGKDFHVKIDSQNNRINPAFTVTGGFFPTKPGSDQNFINTSFHDDMMAMMMLLHSVKDFCIIGPRGCGKTMLVEKFCSLLGYDRESIMLYQDMTARDLLQQRMTLPNGDTAWRHSALINAALDGQVAILDGLHRINPGTFAVLHRLIHDRELSLSDGSRLLRHDRYEKLMSNLNLTDAQMKERQLLRIHPSFRIVALAEPPVIGSTTPQWLSSEMLTVFMFLNMRSLTHQEEMEILQKRVPGLTQIQPLFDLANCLRHSSELHLKNIANSLSLRQLLRIARRLSAWPAEDLSYAVHKACLSQFLPRLARTALESEMSKFGMEKSKIDYSSGAGYSGTCEIKDGILRIGNTTANVYKPENQLKVPDVLFYENPQHLAVMEDMLKDFVLGEHLLLIGNQGVGKNKIVDRFLHLLNRPREYLQLHRDTTVQTLTLQPTVRDGVLIYEDSPLVRAVKFGHILVVDEADKAPTNVTCILKTLVESGEMHLSDGRRIVSGGWAAPSDTIIPVHPDFRMIILANRPGFPFLGNDFFNALGDIFSCYAINNPDVVSETSMLHQYGPDVPKDTIRLLVSAFGELREMADQGLISYPYSTREVVNIVKHLQAFPDQALSNVVRNVFDFDIYNKETSETIITTLNKHGIPVGADPRNVMLSKQFPLPVSQLLSRWTIATDKLSPRSMICPIEDKSLLVKGPVVIDKQTFALNKTETRSLIFTEQEAYWSIPIHETSSVSHLAVTQAKWQKPGGVLNTDIIHVATISPVSLYTMKPAKDLQSSCLDLYDFFPSSTKAKLKVAPLGFPLHNNVILHESTSNAILDINYSNGEVRRLEINSAFGAAVDKISRSFRAQQGVFKMCADFAHEGDMPVLFYKENAQSIEVLHMLEGRCYSIGLPLAIDSIHMLSRHKWLLTEYQTNKKFLLESTAEKPTEIRLQALQESSELLVEMVAKSDLHDTQLSAYLNQSVKSPNRVLSSPNTFVSVAVGLPDLSTIEVHGSVRPVDQYNHMLRSPSQSSDSNLRIKTTTVHLPVCGQLVRLLPNWAAPKESLPEGIDFKKFGGFLEVVDPVNKVLRYIPLPASGGQSMYNHWFGGGSDVHVLLAAMSNDGLVTVDAAGSVMLWETSLSHLDKSLRRWRKMIGEEEGELQLTRAVDKLPEGPKHGRVDTTGAPHVGGNQWAGGTGGRDTAGLGGVGGPYRLDAGHDVTQVPQWQKDEVPEEIKQAAREMAKKAWRQRLKEIEMSEYDGELYESYLNNVQGQVKSLRVIIESLQAKGKERQWLKNQTYGDLDESKLVEGLVGEKSIYRRRGEKDPEPGTPQQKPKLVQIVCDVSGSMYRFNGTDGRLERQLEAMLMVMEAFKDYQDKVKFEITGHSGEGFNFPFSSADKPPKNNKHRLDILKALSAHAQFCISGDSTLQAARHAVKTVTQQEADEHFVILLSDANFDRYGIRPNRLSEILTSDEKVNAFVIFIGSLGDQATRLVKQLPSGKAFVCMDNKQLPNIMQQILTSTVLGGG